MGKRVDMFADLFKRLTSEPRKRRSWQSTIGIVVIALFVVSSTYVSQTVQALNRAAGSYGYLNGTYGYNGSSTSSDSLPNAPTSLTSSNISSTGATISWTAPTTTVDGTAIASSTGGAAAGSVASYNIGYSTASLSSCTGGTTTTSTTASKTLSNLDVGLTYNVAVCAVDNNGNSSAVLTGTVTTAGAGGSSGSGGGSGGSAGGIFSNPTTTTIVTPSGTTTVVSGSTSTTTATTQASLAQILAEAAPVAKGDVAALVVALGISRSTAAEAQTLTKYVNPLVKGYTVSAEQKTVIGSFVNYGTPATKKLGAGERAGVVASFVRAFGKVPKSGDNAQATKDWEDIMKIANGRYPAQRSASAEARAKVSFKKVYLRDAKSTTVVDQNALVVMSYGLRPANRRLSSEAQAIATYKRIYKSAPLTADQWDIVRAIAYGGAKR